MDLVSLIAEPTDDGIIEDLLKYPTKTLLPHRTAVNMYMHARLFPRKKEKSVTFLTKDRWAHDDRIRAWNNRNELLVATALLQAV
jgi:hypothetical protein